MSVWLVHCSFFKRHNLLSFLHLKFNFDLEFLKKLNFYLTFTVWATLESSKTVVTKWRVWTARDTLFSLSYYPTLYSTKSNYLNGLQERNMRGKYSYYIKKTLKDMNDQTCCYSSFYNFYSIHWLNIDTRPTLSMKAQILSIGTISCEKLMNYNILFINFTIGYVTLVQLHP